MMEEHAKIEQHYNPVMPFGYYLERDAYLLILRRSDSSFVASFNARGVDLIEVELTVWEDAD